MIIVQRRIVLNSLPNLVNLGNSRLVQRPLLKPAHRLLQLIDRARTNDQLIPMLLVQERIVSGPSVSQLAPLAASFRRGRLPHVQSLVVRRLVVQVRVHTALSEPACAVYDLLLGFAQESACDGRVSVEGYVELTQCWEKLGLL